MEKFQALEYKLQSRVDLNLTLSRTNGDSSIQSLVEAPNEGSRLGSKQRFHIPEPDDWDRTSNLSANWGDGNQNKKAQPPTEPAETTISSRDCKRISAWPAKFVASAMQWILHSLHICHDAKLRVNGRLQIPQNTGKGPTWSLAL